LTSSLFPLGTVKESSPTQLSDRSTDINQAQNDATMRLTSPRPLEQDTTNPSEPSAGTRGLSTRTQDQTFPGPEEIQQMERRGWQSRLRALIKDPRFKSLDEAVQTTTSNLLDLCENGSMGPPSGRTSGMTISTTASENIQLSANVSEANKQLLTELVNDVESLISSHGSTVSQTSTMQRDRIPYEIVAAHIENIDSSDHTLGFDEYLMCMSGFATPSLLSSGRRAWRQMIPLERERENEFGLYPGQLSQIRIAERRWLQQGNQ
jgi:hypothetical protein